MDACEQKPVLVLSSASWSKANKWRRISNACGWWQTASMASVFLALGIGVYTLNPEKPDLKLLGATVLNASAAIVAKKASDSIARKAIEDWDSEEEERNSDVWETPDEEMLKEYAILHLTLPRFLNGGFFNQ